MRTINYTGCYAVQMSLSDTGTHHPYVKYWIPVIPFGREGTAVYAYVQQTGVGGYIQACINTQQVPVQSQVYLHPRSRVPRDFVRRNYKIVRDKTKADFVILPDVTEDIRTYNYQALVEIRCEQDRTFLCPITLSSSVLAKGLFAFYHITWEDMRVGLKESFMNKFPDETILSSTILDYVNEQELYDRINRKFKKAEMSIIPPVEEYVKLLMNPFSPETSNYRFDTALLLQGMDITAEALYVMRKSEEKNMILQTLSSMNWQLYPTVTAIFLFSFIDNSINRRSSAVNYMLQKLGLLKYPSWNNYRNNILEQNIMSPAEIQLLEDWLFLEVGIEGNSGLVDLNKWDTLPKPLKESYRSKMAISRVNASKPLTYQEVKQTCY